MTKYWAVPVLVSFMAAWAVAAQAEDRLRLSTTTSTENSGLLAALIPPFEKANNIKVDVIAVGTGKALQLGRNGDVDVVLVHARPAEEKFVEEGHGVDRMDVMHNDFVIIGPKGDPAGLKDAKTVGEAFKKLAEGKASFVSRGDDSGTHKKEKRLWKKAGVQPKGSWYLEAGQGMGAVLQMAYQKQAYTMSDRGTYIAFEDKIDLPILFEGDEALYNPYGVIAVDPKKHPDVNYDAAKKFMEYITGPKGQKIIAEYTKNGKQLFFPDAIKNP